MSVELFEEQEAQETFDLDVQEVGGIVSDQAEAAYPTAFCGPGGGRTPLTCTFSSICCCP